MGKTQSREALQEAYLVQTLPAGYDPEARRANENKNVVVYRHAYRQSQSVGRAQSLYSLPTSEATMASTKWRPGMTRKDIVEKKASFLGRFQTHAVTETALDNLRYQIQQSSLKKTKIKLSPLGLSFGTKTTGILQPDKVAYRYIRIEDIESLYTDTVNRDVLLCISKTNDEHTLVHHGQPAIVHAENYEINTFYVDPRDARQLEAAASNFKNKFIIQEGGGVDTSWRSRSLSIPQGDVVDHPQGLRGHPPESREWILATSRSERDVRNSHVDTLRRGTRGHTTDHGKVVERKQNVHTVNQTTNRPSSSYVYNGTLTHEKKSQKKVRHHNAETSVNLPGSFGPVTPDMVQSLTTKVYFDNKNGPAMADVECQVTPKTSTSDSTSRSSVDTTSEQRASRSSSRPGSRNRGKKESVKRRINDLSREMDKLKTMLDASDEESRDTVVETRIEGSSSSSSDNTYRANGLSHANGPTMRVSRSQQESHAGTIDTRAGTVDVIVNHAPNKPVNKVQQVKSTSVKTEVKRSQHNGYYTEPRTVNHTSNNARGRVQQTTVARENGLAGANGRVVYYRPVTPEPLARADGPTLVFNRSRSTEPARTVRTKSATYVYQ